MLNVNKKLYQYVCAICKESGVVSALVENVEIHIDMATRKSADMSDEMFETMVRMKREHNNSGDYPFEMKLKIK